VAGGDCSVVGEAVSVVNRVDFRSDDDESERRIEEAATDEGGRSSLGWRCSSRRPWPRRPLPLRAQPKYTAKRCPLSRPNAKPTKEVLVRTNTYLPATTHRYRRPFQG